jgi:hypothetical protein
MARSFRVQVPSFIAPSGSRCRGRLGNGSGECGEHPTSKDLFGKVAHDSTDVAKVLSSGQISDCTCPELAL